ncbi:MAG: hypothetical protein IJZ26_02240 [Clostridia bacterium]|nr:hypothetical protein [Clostridia bacterium]
MVETIIIREERSKDLNKEVYTVSQSDFKSIEEAKRSSMKGVTPIAKVVMSGENENFEYSASSQDDDRLIMSEIIFRKIKNGEIIGKGTHSKVGLDLSYNEGDLSSDPEIRKLQLTMIVDKAVENAEKASEIKVKTNDGKKVYNLYKELFNLQCDLDDVMEKSQTLAQEIVEQGATLYDYLEEFEIMVENNKAEYGDSVMGYNKSVEPSYVVAKKCLSDFRKNVNKYKETTAKIAAIEKKFIKITKQLDGMLDGELKEHKDHKKLLDDRNYMHECIKESLEIAKNEISGNSDIMDEENKNVRAYFSETERKFNDIKSTIAISVSKNQM